MDNLNVAIDTVYKERERLILVGLTGRTGSGCSTVASILRKKKIDDLDLWDLKTHDFRNSDERKYSIIKRFMDKGNKWSEFVVIEVSSIILSFVLERSIDELIKYLEELLQEKDKKILNIAEFEKVKQNIAELNYMIEEMKNYSLADIKSFIYSDEEKVDKYFNFYTKIIIDYKNRIKDMLSEYSCYEIKKSRLEEKKMIKYHLYTYLMQKIGNNIRSSGDPYSEEFNAENYYSLVSRMNSIIKIINQYKKNKKEKSVRICIDAIRNPFEAYYLRDRYRAFYLVAVSTEDKDRINRLNRLKIDREELMNLDQVEYPSKTDKPQELFYHQNIQQCLEIADIHIFNPDIENSKYYELTTQVLRYIALMLHPGLVTPTHVERCMQLAYNTKYSSGCLSRQVGAVVTGEDFSIKSIGWNDVPKGQIPCNLRDVKSYCLNRDNETFSDYELCDKKFQNVMTSLNSKISDEKLKGKTFSYCFKDIYNGIENSKNQVYTRALHAEENAFLQISKYGGQGVLNGKLFTTASPCELCAKKAYQLGIREIYYIDPYPGISQKHILKFGNENNPNMMLFSGAIGNAYLALYGTRMALKDELELASGVSCKNEAKNYNNLKKSDLDVKDIKYNDIKLDFVFDSRSKIVCLREVEVEILKDELKKINKMMIWTGSSYDGTKLISSDPKCNLIEGVKKEAYYQYTIDFDKTLSKGEHIKYKIRTDVKDEKKIMEPYFSHRVKNKTDKLTLRLSVPKSKNLVEGVRGIEYADLLMQNKFEEIELKKTEEGDYEIYELEKVKPNLFYSYSIEWRFT
ncbi:dCMP deaminase [Clostridium sp. PL3]|uniref:dCMP deaminase n=1 Tax=Clostridium thailandense TaxID=2794346 RepID=A0A949TS62_9CLOT|nr:dCMP deaminase [Clostridium thailandense]MBV7275552.1 dCMP deaminase [Clostridium thailandense]